jgi:hypothetical protein
LATSLSLTNIKENRFKNSVIRQTIKFDKFEWIKYPVARKTMKLYAFWMLLIEEGKIYKHKLRTERKYLFSWITSKKFKLQLA